jgi:hypothetical protein
MVYAAFVGSGSTSLGTFPCPARGGFLYYLYNNEERSASNSYASVAKWATLWIEDWLARRKFGMGGAFWMGILAAQRAASGTKAADRRHHVLSMVGGIALALVIGAGLFIVAGLTN